MSNNFLKTKKIIIRRIQNYLFSKFVKYQKEQVVKQKLLFLQK